MKPRSWLGAGTASLTLLVGTLGSFGGLATVTVHNATSSFLDLFDITGGYYINTSFLTPSQSFVLDDTHAYSVAPYFHAYTGGHNFQFSGGAVLPVGTAPVTSEWFVVQGNDMWVRGIPFRARLVTDNVGYGYETMAVGNGTPAGAAWLGGPDYELVLTPADTNFDGTYPNFLFGVPAANNGTMQLGTNFGVASWVGAGASFTPTSAFGGLLTLSNGNVLEITAVPEPSALMLLLVAGCAMAWRRARRE